VKNNLQIVTSLLNLQAGLIADPRITALFRESQNRVKSMALIHETLYRGGNLATLDFQKYVQDLVRYLYRSYRLTPTQIDLQLAVERLPLTLDTAIPCGLILTELVSNAFKYAFPTGAPGTVHIEARQEQTGEFLLRVADDGQGLPPDLDYRRSPSLGLQLVTSLARQLEAVFEREPTERGTNFVIRFKDRQHGENPQEPPIPMTRYHTG
jgi:two-component sensor histidine kinase